MTKKRVPQNDLAKKGVPKNNLTKKGVRKNDLTKKGVVSTQRRGSQKNPLDQEGGAQKTTWRRT